MLKRVLAFWFCATVLSAQPGTLGGGSSGSGSLTDATINAGTNVALSGDCSSSTILNCTISGTIAAITSGTLMGNISGESAVPEPLTPAGFNITTAAWALTQKWRLALAKVRDGARDAKILFVGDSITTGYGDTTTSTVPTIGSFPYRASTLFNSPLYPAAPGLGIPPTATGDIVDQRWTVGTGWSLGTSVGFAQNMYTGTSPAGTLVFTPGAVGVYDSFDVYYVGTTGTGTLTATATGGTPVVQNMTSGCTGICKITATALLPSTTNALTLSMTGLGYIVGVEPFYSNVPTIRFANAGVGGSTTTEWADSGSFYSLASIEAYQPDLTIIELGVNDAGASISAATVQTNLEAIITAAQISGDVIIMTMPPSSGTPYSTYELLYQPVFALLSASYNAPLIDVWTRFGGTYDSSWMYDNYHLNEDGSWDIAGAINQLLSGISGSGFVERNLTGSNPGPVPYIGANGFLSEDSSNALCIDATNHRVGLGTCAPDTEVEILATGIAMHIEGATGHSGFIEIDNADGTHQSQVGFYSAGTVKFTAGTQPSATDFAMYDSTNSLVFFDYNVSAKTLTLGGTQGITMGGPLTLYAALPISQGGIGNTSLNGAGIVVGSGNLSTGGNPGPIPYISAAGTLSEDATNYCWDAANHRLGIGTCSPDTQVEILATGIAMHVSGATGHSGFIEIDNADGTHESEVGFYSAGTQKFTMASLASATGFTIYDAANTLSFFNYTAGSTKKLDIASVFSNSGIPTSAGSGGLYVCVDTTGAMYKKASCP